MNGLARRLSGRVHYAWVVAATIFLALAVSAGVRSMPGVLLVPLMDDMHWDRPTISLAIAVGIALYGLTGPFAAAAMQVFGIRRTTLSALALIAAAVASTTLARAPWQMVLTWGVLTGLGTGTIANVLAVTIVNRWFKARRGLVMGVLTASVATGQLVFLPALARLIELSGWRQASLLVAVATALVVPLVLFLVPERPESVGLLPYGASGPSAAAAGGNNPLVRAFAALGHGVRQPVFWLLWGSFFVCGLSTNGLIGTHLIALCMDHGLTEVRAAGLLAAMGILDLFGTSFSGWLSDRFDNRLLLAWYYGLRGLALMFLPFSDFTLPQLSLFALFYGLDWIATVPPTVRLANEAFGEQDSPILFGWISAGHQMGAAAAAYGAGLLREIEGTYLQALLLAGAACVLVALTMIGSSHNRRRLVGAMAE